MPTNTAAHTLASRRTMTPPQAAARCGIGPDKVLAWIRSGELKAWNAAANLGGRPRWLINVDDLERFIASRSNARSRPAQSASRKKVSGDFVRYY
jgi:excisionase family DNA binding protein